MTAAEALDLGRRALAKHRCPSSDASREAELFLSLATGRSRESLLAHPELPLDRRQSARFRACLKRRLAHEPVDHIAGSTWFMGRRFLVNRHTLIPRWATETVAAAAIEAGRGLPRPLVIDVGTGSGCLALTLAAELPEAGVLASDISAAALTVARRNAAGHGLTGRVRFLRGDLLAPAARSVTPDRPLLLCANLPYLSAAQVRRLPPEIRDREPRSALVGGGPDGLDAYRRLAAQLAGLRLPVALAVVWEILPGQYRPLASLLRKKIPGLSVRKLLNSSGVCVGLLAVRG